MAGKAIISAFGVVSAGYGLYKQLGGTQIGRRTNRSARGPPPPPKKKWKASVRRPGKAKFYSNLWPRKGNARPMSIVGSGPKRHARTMPRYNRRYGRRTTAGRRSFYKKRFAARRRYAGRSTGFRKYRRGRRMVNRTRLRIYAGGFPVTKKIKLRILKQVVIHSRIGEWGYVNFFPADLHDPLVGYLTPSAAVGNHQRLVMVDKANAVLPRPQPYGFDHWLGDVGADHYRKYKVLGCQISLTLIPNKTLDTSETTHYAGWAGIFPEADTDGTTFATRYDLINRLEISDMLNCKLIKNPRIINLSTAQRFSLNYSARAWGRMRRGVGISAAERWYGEHDTAPEINPVAKFIIADLGAADSGVIAYNFLFEQTFTVQLTGGRLGNVSNAAV